MRGHVVGAFAGVAVGEGFGRERAEAAFEIERHVGVSVFVDRERGRGVF